jgi:hypothetical protein
LLTAQDGESLCLSSAGSRTLFPVYVDFGMSAKVVAANVRMNQLASVAPARPELRRASCRRLSVRHGKLL